MVPRFPKDSEAFKELLEAMFSPLPKEVMEELATTSWLIWKRRNELTFRDEFTHPSLLMQQSKQLMQDKIGNSNNRSEGRSVEEQEIWTAPPQGYYKVNCEGKGLGDKTNSKVGVGAIVRDWEGTVLAILIMRLNKDLYPDPCLAEAMAAQHAIVFCQNLGFKHIILEGYDSLQVVKAMQQKELWKETEMIL